MGSHPVLFGAGTQLNACKPEETVWPASHKRMKHTTHVPDHYGLGFFKRGACGAALMHSLSALGCRTSTVDTA